jgi:hypothetical protein
MFFFCDGTFIQNLGNMFEFEFKTKTCFQKEQKKERRREVNKRKTPSAPPLSLGGPAPSAQLSPAPPSVPPGPARLFPWPAHAASAPASLSHGPGAASCGQPIPRPSARSAQAAPCTAATPSVLSVADAPHIAHVLSQPPMPLPLLLPLFLFLSGCSLHPHAFFPSPLCSASTAACPLPRLLARARPAQRARGSGELVPDPSHGPCRGSDPPCLAPSASATRCQRTARPALGWRGQHPRPARSPGRLLCARELRGSAGHGAAKPSGPVRHCGHPRQQPRRCPVLATASRLLRALMAALQPRLRVRPATPPLCRKPRAVVPRKKEARFAKISSTV